MISSICDKQFFVCIALTVAIDRIVKIALKRFEFDSIDIEMGRAGSILLVNILMLIFVKNFSPTLPGIGYGIYNFYAVWQRINLLERRSFENIRANRAKEDLKGALLV